MSFSEKLNKLMLQYNIKNIDLAKEMNISPSFVSKIRRGIATLPPYSDIYDKLYYAFDHLLSDEQIMDLKKQYNLSWDKKSFSTWICEDCIKSLPKFSICLYKLMDFFDISNKTLAKELNFDPSLISRYKTGDRIPSTDNKIINQIVDYFANLTLERKCEEELLQYIGVKSVNACKKEDFVSIIFSWFMNEDLDTKLMDKIFHMMEEYHSFVPDFKKVSNLLKDTYIPPYHIIKKQGNEGLRQLVLLFLSLCCKSEKKLELKLFSNQNMSWMIEDPEFFQTWRALMLTILECGHKIFIIHNIERKDKEMFSAIEGWLPLHLSGNIESYYYTASFSNPFSNTIFSSGSFAVYGNFIDSLENETDFYFTQEQNTIQKLEEAFEDLTKHSQKLLKTLNIKSIKDIDFFIPTEKKINHTVHLMQQNLPIWHIDEDLLAEILSENNVSKKEHEYICAYIEKLRSFYKKVLKNNSFFEYFYIPKQRIYEKKPFDFLNINGQDRIYYTETQYKKQLINIAKTLETYKNYHIVLLDKPIYDSIKLFQFESNSIFAIKNKFPVSAIQYESDILIAKFHSYISSKQEKSISSLNDYEEVFNQLLTK